MLDGDLPREVEKSYVAGERDAYVQHIYAKRGKKLQKMLQTRYETERTLRTRIDSYIRLFERLLDAVSEAPKGSELVEGTLESEAGKLYMMLAEASGRISPA